MPSSLSLSLDESLCLVQIEIEYLHHRQAHHRDTPDRRLEKARRTAAAHLCEVTRSLAYPKAVAQWTAEDLAFVIDLVRADMPATSPADDVTHTHTDPGDPYQDGRALQCVSFLSCPKGPRGQQWLWFSTAAGYSARVFLPSCPPAHAIVPFVCARARFFCVEITLDRRAARAVDRTPVDLPRGGGAS